MPHPADNLISPAATVWPPPPSSAPETFTVEGVTVTRDGEQLTIYNHKIKWNFIPSLFQYFFFGFGWFTSVRGWLDFHNHFGPPGPPLNDPFFVHKLESLTSTYLVMALIFTGFMWYAYAQVQNKGLTMLSRQAKALKVGKYLATVTAVDVRKQSVWRSSFSL